MLIIDKVNVIYLKNKIFNFYLGWEKICVIYIFVDGGEKFVMIGNFFNNEGMKYEINKKVKDNKFVFVIGVYYFVDDVIVELLEEKEVCNCNYEDVENK